MGVTFSNVRSGAGDSTSSQTYSHQRKTTASLEVQALTNEDQAEVLAFLSQRPIHTVCMAGYILDHGIVSPLNRGTFYGCRSKDGALQGVALIGHATLLEAQSDEALKAFAKLKHQYESSHLIRGEHSMIERFWREYAELGNERRLACRELLLEQVTIPTIDGPAPDLRPATPDNLETVMNINADLLQAECGINPLSRDLEGFRKRLLTRIEQGRIWVWSSDDRLLFKVDVFAETPAMTYVEGVYVHPMGRGQGHGVRCMVQLSRLLRTRTQSICLLVNERKKRLEKFYNKAGYRARAWYDTIYLHRDVN
jgi:GNAT superfamily N-acetyltransferase